MTFRQSCSWCHHVNVIRQSPTFCADCGHRADVARLSCDCPKCAMGRGGPFDLPQSVADDALEAARKRLRETDLNDPRN